MLNMYTTSFIFEILFFTTLLILLLQKTGITVTNNLLNVSTLFANTSKLILYFIEIFFLLFVFKLYYQNISFILVKSFFNLDIFTNLFNINIFIYIQLYNINYFLNLIMYVLYIVINSLTNLLALFSNNVLFFTIQLKLLLPVIKSLIFLFMYNIYYTVKIMLNFFNCKSTVWLIFGNFIPVFTKLDLYYFSNEVFNYKLFDYNYFTFYNKYILLIFITVYYIIIYYYYKFSFSSKNQLIFTYEYPILIGFLFIGYVLVISSNNLFIVYLGFEIQTFTILLLSGQLRNLYLIVITNLKYFFYSFLSSLFFLLGILYIYNFSSTLNYYELYYFFIYSLGFNINNYFLLLGLNLLLLSFVFKLGLFPFYIWVLDIFEGFPRLITLLLLTLNKFNLYVFLLKFITIISSFNLLIFNFNLHFLTLISLISIFIGSLLSLTQTNLQRFFGATSITHLGFLSLLLKVNLLNYNLNNLYLIYSYFILYMVLTFIFFGNLIIWSSLFSRLKSYKVNNYFLNYIKDITIFNVYSKKTLFVLILILLNLSGFPPFSFFYIKFNLIWLLSSTFSNLDLLLLLYFSTLITGSYIRLISILWLENISDNFNNFKFYKFSLQQFSFNNFKLKIIFIEYFSLLFTTLTLGYNYIIYLF